MMDSLLIARWFPGLGDPFDLTLARWNAALDRLQDIVEMEHPCDAEQAVSRELSRIKRQKRRAKASQHDGHG